MQETSVEGDPQSNGAAESSVNVVKRRVRSINMAVEPASGVEVPADHDLLTWLVPYAASMHRWFAVGRDGKTAYERNVGAQFGERVWWMPLQPSNRRLDPLDSRFEQGRYLGPMDGSNTVFIGTASGVVKARTIKRLPPGERWTDSLLHEALGSELTPNALEDDGGRVGIRAPVLQPHAAVPLPTLVPEVRKVRRAPLLWTDFEQVGYTDNCPGCANARAGRKQAMDHPEHCRSRMEAILSTTTEGHERLEHAIVLLWPPRNGRMRSLSARDMALRAKGSSLSRHQHRVFEGTTRKEAAVAAVRHCRLRQRHHHFNHRRLQNGVRNRRPK